MNQQKTTKEGLQFSIVRNPKKEILAKAIEYLNSNITAGNFNYLMCRSTFDVMSVDAWHEEQVVGSSIKLIGIDCDSRVISVAYLHRGHGNGFHTAKLGITVDPNYQRKGVAHTICKELFECGVEDGVVRVEAQPVIANKDAVVFLQRLGFLIEGIASKRFRFDETTYYDCLHMVKFLKT